MLIGLSTVSHIVRRTTLSHLDKTTVTHGVCIKTSKGFDEDRICRFEAFSVEGEVE